MDTTDPDIVFDASGVCSHCHRYERVAQRAPSPRSRTQARLEALVAEVRAAGRGKPYDCVIGVSGGVDSTYVAWVVKELGLRPLAVHLDNGWNSELAVANIEKTLNTLGIDLSHARDRLGGVPRPAGGLPEGFDAGWRGPDRPRHRRAAVPGWPRATACGT